MALGTNRDYKTAAAKVTMNLKLHEILTRRWIAAGETKESASSKAFTELNGLTKAERKRMYEEFLRGEDFVKRSAVKEEMRYEIFCGAESTMLSLAEKGVVALNRKTMKWQIVSATAKYEVRLDKFLTDPGYTPQWSALLYCDQDLRQIAEEKGMTL